jgi:DNA-binding CsgD family transcriptional regulator/PAS domain-containing protein
LAEPISPRVLSALIASIYDCALDPSLWEKALADIGARLDCQVSVLYLTDVRRDRFLMYRTVGIEPYWLEQQAKYMPEVYAILARDLASWPSFDEPHLVSRHTPPTLLETSPYFREWLRPQGLVDIMTYFLLHTSSRLAGFAVARHESRGIITKREIDLASLLLPHVRRAVTISNVLDAGTIERSRLAEALDALRCAVLLTDERGVILHANSTADAMLRDGSLIRSAGGVLRATAAAAAAELRAAIGLAAHDEAEIGKTGLAIRLTEPEMSPVFAHVLPLKGGELRASLQPAAVAAVFISAPADALDGAEAMSAAFGLTGAETRVLAGLLAGHTLAETAATLAIAVSTATTHLGNIFSKTGANRQSELMRLGSHLVPPTGGNK